VVSLERERDRYGYVYFHTPCAPPGPAARLAALRANPIVVITIDTESFLHFMSFKSEAGGGDGVDGVVEEYEEAAFPAEMPVCR
jgi:hypothetical protein